MRQTHAPNVCGLAAQNIDGTKTPTQTSFPSLNGFIRQVNSNYLFAFPSVPYPLFDRFYNSAGVFLDSAAVHGSEARLRVGTFRQERRLFPVCRLPGKFTERGATRLYGFWPTQDLPRRVLWRCWLRAILSAERPRARRSSNWEQTFDRYDTCRSYPPPTFFFCALPSPLPARAAI